MRVDIILEDERAGTLIVVLRGSGVSFAGKGDYWVCDVGRLRGCD